jgi:hypothetical protein
MLLSQLAQGSLKKLGKLKKIEIPDIFAAECFGADLFTLFVSYDVS